jgi:hypothetical protein
MSNRSNESKEQQEWSCSEGEAVYEYVPKGLWGCFEEAAYAYGQERALRELEQEGYVGPPGGLAWAFEYLPAFLEGLDEDVFADFSVDDEYFWEEVEYRFVRSFRKGWRVGGRAFTFIEEEFG